MRRPWRRCRPCRPSAPAGRWRACRWSATVGEGLILLAAAIIGLLCRFWPAHLPYIFPFVFNPLVFIGCWFVALWYWRGMKRTPPEARPGRLRQGFFIAGIAGIYFVLQTHFEYVSQHMF